LSPSKLKAKHHPSPALPVLSIQIEPLIASTSCLQIARPSPLPGWLLVVAFGKRTKRWNSLG
jgi:hypothetical protein